jgi:hypothetical protein
MDSVKQHPVTVDNEVDYDLVGGIPSGRNEHHSQMGGCTLRRI